MKKIFAIIGLVGLIGYGCAPGAQTPSQATVESQQMAVQTQESRFGISAAVKEMKASNIPTCEGYYLYSENFSDCPLIDPGLQVTAKKYSYTYKSKTYLIGKVLPVFQGYSAATQAKVQRRIKRLYDETLAQYAAGITGWDAESAAKTGNFNTVSIWFTPYILTKDLISMPLYYSLPTGGAHPLHFTDSFTYDVAAGKEIGLKDFFKKDSNYLQKISEIVIKKYIKDFDEAPNSTYMDIFFAPKKGHYEDLIVTKDGIEFFFWLAEAGPYVATVSWDEIRDILKEDGPATTLIKKPLSQADRDEKNGTYKYY